MAADPIDVHVGQVIRARRHVNKLSQIELGEWLGVSFQQVQKYERAANRVSCSMLYRLSIALKSRVSDFFPDADLGGAGPGLGDLAELATHRDGQEIGRCWREMTPAGRVAFLSVALALAASGRPGGQIDIEEAAGGRRASTIAARV